jgi:hypothetical protein
MVSPALSLSPPFAPSLAPFFASGVTPALPASFTPYPGFSSGLTPTQVTQSQTIAVQQQEGFPARHPVPTFAYKAGYGFVQPLQQQVKLQLQEQARQLEQQSQAVSGHLDTWQTGFLKLGDKLVPHRLKKAALHSVTESMEQTSHRNELDLNALSPFNPVSYVLSEFVKEELMHRILERQQAQIEALTQQTQGHALMVSYMA